MRGIRAWLSACGVAAASVCATQSFGQLDAIMDKIEGREKGAPMPRMHVVASSPRYYTSSIEFHDPLDELWPTYLLARAADEEGWFLFGEKRHEGRLVVKSHLMAQVGGTQDRRLGGELARLQEVKGKDGTMVKTPVGPDVLVRVEEIGAIETEELKVSRQAAKGVEVQVKKIVYTPVKLAIDVNGRVTRADGRMFASLNMQVNSMTLKREPASVPIRLEFRLKGSDLGLKEHAARDVDVLVHTEAFTELKSEQQKKEAMDDKVLEASAESMDGVGSQLGVEP